MLCGLPGTWFYTGSVDAPIVFIAARAMNIKGADLFQGCNSATVVNTS